jgi:putative membrane protein
MLTGRGWNPTRHRPAGAERVSDLNDPRVFFAAERTLLAWNRTALALMAFGFAIERFGLFVKMLMPPPSPTPDTHLSFWLGTALVALGSLSAIFATLQYRKVLRTLRPIEIPERYWTGLAAAVTLAVAVVGAALVVHLLLSSR